MGKPGAKKLDQIVSVTPGDVHIILIPSPAGPVPTPIPHPVPNSMILDKVQQKVKVMGQPGAVVGSKSKHTPPHIPMGGPFQKPPKNEGEIITGSANVFYQGKKAAMLGDTAKMCVDPADAPVGKVIGKALTVLIGGGGSGSGGKDKDKGKAKNAQGAGDAAGLNQTTAEGHPVDVATGKLMISGEDLTLDGPLPIQFVRTYLSSSSSTDGPMGYGWSHNLQESVEFVIDGDEDYPRIHQRFVDAGNPSPQGGYLIYRDPNGLPTPYHPLADGEEVTDEFHRRTIYHQGGNYTITNRDGIRHRFSRVHPTDKQLVLAEVTDRNGNTKRLQYDDRNRPVEIEDCYGRALLITYHGEHVGEINLRIPGEVALRLWCTYEYDDHGNLVAVTDRAGFTTRYAYVDHLATQDQNRDGYSFFFAYDDRRRCNHTWGQDGYLTRYLFYDPQKSRTRVINGEGEQTIYYHTDAGVVWRTEKGSSYSTELTFDDTGKLLARAHGGGTIVTLDYDDVGNVVAMTDGDEQTTEYEYNDLNQVTSLTKPLGETTTFEYDKRGNMTARCEANGGVIRFQHDESGRVIREIHPDRLTIETTYNRFGHCASISRGGILTNYRHDPLGNPLSVTEAGRPPTSYEWNARGFPTRIINGGETTLALEYNGEGDLIDLTNAEGVHRHYEIRCPSVVAELAEDDTLSVGGRTLRSRIKYHTDSEGRIVDATDHLGRITEFTYDDGGILISEKEPDGNTRKLNYDPTGRLSRIHDQEGILRLQHDLRGLPIEVTYPDHAVDSFVYDEHSRLVAATNDLVALEFEYDELGRQVVKRQGDYELHAEFDTEKKSISWCWPEGIKAVYEYDDAGNVSAVVFGGQRFEFRRTESGLLESRVYPNGVVETMRPDAQGRLAELSINQNGNSLRRQTIGYQRGKISEIEDSVQGRREFKYDQQGHLTQVTGDVSEFYQFDKFHNLIGSHRIDQSRTDGAERLLQAGRRSYDYDTLSRVTRVDEDDQQFQFSYDAKGQLRRVNLPDGGTVHYRYDVFGRRIEKRFEGGERNWRRIAFFWDSNQLAKEEVWEGNKRVIERYYLFTGLAPLARIDQENGKTRMVYYHNSHHGLPLFCTAEQGEIIWEFAGDSFGYEKNRRDSFQNIRFPGQYYDEETGLCYNRFRYYDAGSARYLQPDAVRRLGDINRYAYPTDPLTRLDPLGMDTVILNGDPADPTVSGGNVPGYGEYEGSAPILNRTTPNSTTTNLYDTEGPDLSGANHVIINTHGSPNSIAVTDQNDRATTHRMSGTELAEYLRAQGFQGNKVTVVACSTGSSSGTFAQDLADGLGEGVEVVAPTDTVRVRTDGGIAVDDGGSMRTFRARSP